MKKWIGIILVLIMVACLGGCCWPYYHHGYPGERGGYDHHDRGGDHNWDRGRDRY